MLYILVGLVGVLGFLAAFMAAVGPCNKAQRLLYTILALTGMLAAFGAVIGLVGPGELHAVRRP